MTNRDFSQNPDFISACERARVRSTVRQASKFRNKKGVAYGARRETLSITERAQLKKALEVLDGPQTSRRPAN
jgi:hypothetical protein